MKLMWMPLDEPYGSCGSSLAATMCFNENSSIQGKGRVSINDRTNHRSQRQDVKDKSGQCPVPLM